MFITVTSMLNLLREIIGVDSENCMGHINKVLGKMYISLNPLNAELNPICYLLALLTHHFLHVSRIRVKSLTLRLLMSYIYIYIYIWSAYS